MLFLACLGGMVFQLLSIPIPWMLGPLVFVLIGQFFLRNLAWPHALRNSGMVLVGITIGQAFVVDVFLESNVAELIIYLVVLNISLLVFAFMLARLTQRWTGQSFMNALVCSIPGGLSQIIMFAVEQKNIDVAQVTYFHVIRVLAVVILIPFIISPHATESPTVPFVFTDVPALVMLVGVCVIGVPLAAFLRVPTPYILGPVIVVMVLKIYGVDLPVLPTTLQQLAQLCIGAYIGLLLKPHMLKLSPKVLMAGILNAALLLFITYIGALLLMQALPIHFATAFLATAPGGLDQMGILAAAVGASVSFVTLFQLVRIFFIFFVAMPIVQLMNRKALKTKNASR